MYLMAKYCLIPFDEK